MRLLFGTLALTLLACGASAPLQETLTRALELRPLPGGLDDEPMLHSNSPERIETEGVILSTEAPRGGPFLDWPLSGHFSLFMHHVARRPLFDNRSLWIGLVASGSSRLIQTAGQVFCTGPDAPFVNLPDVQANDAGRLYAGPGDRVARVMLQAKGETGAWSLSAGSLQLLHQWRIQTNPYFVFQLDNAISGLLRFHSSGPVRLSLLALLSSGEPRMEDWRRLLRAGKVAGPAEDEASLLPATGGVFRYGRVAGVVTGSHWDGEISYDLGQDPARAFPLSALYAHDLATGQNQSARLQVKVPGTAAESHGNFGVDYRLQLRLSNTGSQPRRLELAIAQPLSASPGSVRFGREAGQQLRFRGSVRLRWQDQTRWFHLQLRDGQQAPPFAELRLNPQQQLSAELEWIYPADATPPQLLILNPAEEKF